jgi:hypothetical protein
MGFFELEIMGILLWVSVLVVFKVLELIVGILDRLPEWVNRMGLFGFDLSRNSRVLKAIDLGE